MLAGIAMIVPFVGWWVSIAGSVPRPVRREIRRRLSISKDEYGGSWQVAPNVLPRRLSAPDPAKAGRVMEAMMQMKTLDIAELERAHAG
jgi:hypothetical protein